MKHICIFDVNETLLDLAALDTHIARIFGDAALRRAWFTQMLQCALVSIVTNTYSDFGSTGIAALEMLAERQHVELTQNDRQAIREGMQHLPAHPEVRA